MNRIKALLAWIDSRRMGWSTFATIALALLVAVIAPHQVAVLLYKLVCISAGAVTLFLVMRELLDCNRPSKLLLPPDESGHREAKPGCEVRLWIAIALQGLAGLAGAVAMALAL